MAWTVSLNNNNIYYKADSCPPYVQELHWPWPEQSEQQVYHKAERCPPYVQELHWPWPEQSEQQVYYKAKRCPPSGPGTLPAYSQAASVNLRAAASTLCAF